MKRVLLALFALGMVFSATALDRADTDKRILKLTSKFEAMQSKPEKRVPAEMLKKAKGIVLLDRTKAGFVFAYQGGNGVAMLRNRSGDWTAPAFLRADEASLGFQIGGQQSFFVILLMHTNAVQNLVNGSISFGGEASGTAGNTSDGVEGNMTDPEQLTVVYSDKSGLYGGAAVKGGSVAPDADANIAAYDEFLTAREILLEGKAKPSQAAKKLAGRIESYSKGGDK